MTASTSLALFKTPVAQGDYSPTGSAFPPRANPPGRKPFFASPRTSSHLLTATLPDAEGVFLFGLAALAIPSVGYCLLQLSHLLSGGLLQSAVRAFLL